MTSTANSSPLGQYSPLREMILDNCALFKKISSKNVMIITEKRPTGQIVACAMVRGVVPGTIVCSDPSDNLDGALTSLHEKSMRTVHSHRATPGGTQHVSDRRANNRSTRCEDDNEDWPSDYDVLSETSDDLPDDEDSDTDGEDAPVLTPATTTTSTISNTGEDSIVPCGPSKLITYAITCPHRLISFPPVRVCPSCAKPPTALRQVVTAPELDSRGRTPVSLDVPPTNGTLQTPAYAACSTATSLGCHPVAPTGTAIAHRAMPPRGPQCRSTKPDRQPCGQPQQVGPSRPAQFRRGEPQQQGNPVFTAPTGVPVNFPRQDSSPDVKVSPALLPSINDTVFDVAFTVNWKGRSQSGFLARSQAGLKALQVTVLDYCMQHSPTFKGQLAPVPAVVQRSSTMPLPVAVVVTNSEVRSDPSGSSATQSDQEITSTPYTAQPASPGLAPQRMPIQNTAALLRPIPFAPKHDGMVWWTDGWLKVRMLSAGAGYTAVTYDLKAYTGENLATLFRMCTQSGNVPTVEVEVEFARRPARSAHLA